MKREPLTDRLEAWLAANRTKVDSCWVAIIVVIIVFALLGWL